MSWTSNCPQNFAAGCVMWHHLRLEKVKVWVAWTQDSTSPELASSPDGRSTESTGI